MKRFGSTRSSLISAMAIFGTTVRTVSTGRFDHPPFSYRQRHTFETLPIHDANYFGGRTAQLREIGPIDGKKRGRLFKRNKEITQYNVDVWCAQQTLRKRWKGRDWTVVEMPFELAPKELQRVIPEMYTDVPQWADAKRGDYSNIRSKVYDVEELQPALFAGRETMPYSSILKRNETAMTLDKFL